MNRSNRRDDRIFIETRVIAAIVVLVLALAFVALYVQPGSTDTDFAWTIKPDLTALLMGAGYTGGAYYLLRVVFAKQWHRAHLGFLPITAFTIFMLGATLLHLDRFHQGDWHFYFWTVIYIVTPFLVPFIWWRNHQTDPGVAETNDVTLSNNTRRALEFLGGVGVLLALIFFALPNLMIALAPWSLTLLTARVSSGWMALASLTVFMIGYDGRWSAARVLVQAAIVSDALFLLAIPRAVNDLNWTNPLAWLLVAALVVMLFVFAVAHLRLDAARGSPAPAK